MAQQKWSPFTGLIILLMGAAVIWLISSLNSSGSAKQISYSDFLADIEAGKVSQVEVTETALIGTLKEPANGATKQVSAARPPNMPDARLMDLLETRKVTIVG